MRHLLATAIVTLVVAPGLDASGAKATNLLRNLSQHCARRGGHAAKRPLKATAWVIWGGTASARLSTAQRIARAIGAKVQRIDLSQVVNKYIGETEKNLGLIAKKTGALLFFDEADALFGKRTEVKDSHDRYGALRTLASSGVRLFGVRARPKTTWPTVPVGTRSQSLWRVLCR